MNNNRLIVFSLSSKFEVVSVYLRHCFELIVSILRILEYTVCIERVCACVRMCVRVYRVDGC